MKPQTYLRGQALRVFWVDSSHRAGWRYDDPPVLIEEVSTLGWVVNTNRKGLNMTTSISKHGGILSLVTIPWQSVTNIQVIPEWNRDANLPL